MSPNENNESDSRISKLENNFIVLNASVSDIKTDVKEIKSDSKEIKSFFTNHLSTLPEQVGMLEGSIFIIILLLAAHMSFMVSGSSLLTSMQSYIASIGMAVGIYTLNKFKLWKRLRGMKITKVIFGEQKSNNGSVNGAK